jgi:hypothetical protein
LRPCRGSEVGFAHDRLTRHEKNNVVRHQRQDRLDIACLACSHPGGNELSNFLLIVLHIQSSVMTPNFN